MAGTVTGIYLISAPLAEETGEQWLPGNEEKVANIVVEPSGSKIYGLRENPPLTAGSSQLHLLPLIQLWLLQQYIL